MERTKPHNSWGIVQQPGGYAVTGFGLIPDVTWYDVPVKNE
jgi:hypothetical protein